MMSTRRLNSIHFIRFEDLIFGKAIENGTFLGSLRIITGDFPQLS